MHIEPFGQFIDSIGILCRADASDSVKHHQAMLLQVCRLRRTSLPAEAAHVKLRGEPESHHTILLNEVHGHLTVRTACHYNLSPSASGRIHCEQYVSICLAMYTCQGAPRDFEVQAESAPQNLHCFENVRCRHT